MDLGLRGRACIVTGASRGIGLATAVALAAEGASLLLAGRDAEALAGARRTCADAGAAAGQQAGEVGARTISLDITEPDAGDRLAETCVEMFGRLDVLVNNAGTSFARALDELTDDDWQSQWELNVIAPMRLMRAAAPIMARAGWGRIVNVSSSSGKRPSATNVAYSVTKAAQLSLSRSFADAYAGRGVLVNAVTPGPVATSLWMGPGGLADQLAQAHGVSRDEVLASTGARNPLGRLGTETEIAAVIAFLCSEAASNVAGAAWSVDGGAVPGIL